MPHVSVIICTCNQARQLARTLDGFTKLVLPADFNWELVVVDNNSTDNTRPVCEEFGCSGASVKRRPESRADSRRLAEPPLQLRYIFEPHPGQSCALNRAISETSSPLLAITQEDVDVTPGWLAALWSAANRYPHASFFGGRILPHWEQPVPAWVSAHSANLLNGVVMHLDRGDAEQELIDPPHPFVVYGANMMFRRSVFETGLRFREDLGVRPGERVPEDESDLIRQLLRQGKTGVYVPEAVVYHRNSPQRATERYVREWFKGAGIADVRLGRVPTDDHVPQLFGAPRHLWRKLVERSVRYLCTRWTRPSAVWLAAEINMARTWGMIYELRRRMLTPSRG